MDECLQPVLAKHFEQMKQQLHHRSVRSLSASSVQHVRKSITHTCPPTIDQNFSDERICYEQRKVDIEVHFKQNIRSPRSSENRSRKSSEGLLSSIQKSQTSIGRLAV